MSLSATVWAEAVLPAVQTQIEEESVVLPLPQEALTWLDWR